MIETPIIIPKIKNDNLFLRKFSQSFETFHESKEKFLFLKSTSVSLNTPSVKIVKLKLINCSPKDLYFIVFYPQYQST